MLKLETTEIKNIDLTKLLISTVDRKLGRVKNSSLKLITYIDDRLGHDKRYAIDSTKLIDELGWMPSLKFEEGIDKTVTWYIENKEWNDGLGKSIAVGVATIQKNSEYNSILVMLGDQPFITSRYLDKMISKFNENQSPVIATNYSGKPGVPALFPHKNFSELIKISGDSGAKSILKNHANIIKLEAENTFDVDSPEDYKKLCSEV